MECVLCRCRVGYDVYLFKFLKKEAKISLRSWPDSLLQFIIVCGVTVVLKISLWMQHSRSLAALF